MQAQKCTTASLAKQRHSNHTLTYAHTPPPTPLQLSQREFTQNRVIMTQTKEVEEPNLKTHTTVGINLHKLKP